MPGLASDKPCQLYEIIGNFETPGQGPLNNHEDILERLGDGRRHWLAKIWESRRSIQQEPITASDGEILAEPIFWFQVDRRVFACFGNEEPGAHTLHKLEDNGIDICIIRPGEDLPSQLA